MRRYFERVLCCICAVFGYNALYMWRGIDTWHAVTLLLVASLLFANAWQITVGDHRTSTGNSNG